jgi:uncharacterized protein
MKPQFKSFPFEIKAIDDAEGMIEGYASTFGNIDYGDDVVDPGAFKKTIKESKGIIPILNNHNPYDQIGWNKEAKEDSSGLFVRGQIDMNTPNGKARFSLAKTGMELGAKSGLSIGYMTIKSEPDKERPAVRRLKELKLLEYSMVTFPMNDQAMVTAAKSWLFGEDNLSIEDMTKLFFEKARDCGFSKEQITEALRTGAAEDSQDPSALVQSMDRLINQLKT